jgi:hypothetical protein
LLNSVEPNVDLDIRKAYAKAVDEVEALKSNYKVQSQAEPSKFKSRAFQSADSQARGDKRVIMQVERGLACIKSLMRSITHFDVLCRRL